MKVVSVIPVKALDFPLNCPETLAADSRVSVESCDHSYSLNTDSQNQPALMMNLKYKYMNQTKKLF